MVIGCACAQNSFADEFPAYVRRADPQNCTARTDRRRLRRTLPTRSTAPRKRAARKPPLRPLTQPRARGRKCLLVAECGRDIGAGSVTPNGAVEQSDAPGAPHHLRAKRRRQHPSTTSSLVAPSTDSTRAAGGRPGVAEMRTGPGRAHLIVSDRIRRPRHRWKRSRRHRRARSCPGRAMSSIWTTTRPCARRRQTSGSRRLCDHADTGRRRDPIDLSRPRHPGPQLSQDGTAT